MKQHYGLLYDTWQMLEFQPVEKSMSTVSMDKLTCLERHRECPKQNNLIINISHKCYAFVRELQRE